MYAEAAAAVETIKELERRLINTFPERTAGEAVATSLAELLEQQLHTQKKMMNDLAANEVVQEQIDEFVSKNEFAGPAAAQAQINELKIHEEQLTAKKETMDNLAAKKNFAEAAAAQ